MNSRNFKKPLLLVLLLLSGWVGFSQIVEHSILQQEVLGPPRKLLPSSFYTPSHFANDERQEIILGKVSNINDPTTREVVTSFKNPEKTVVFSSEVDPEEIIQYPVDPDKLFFKNGKAYILINNRVSFLTPVEFIGENTHMSNPEIRKAVDEFVFDNRDQIADANLITVEFQANNYTISAFKSSSFESEKILIYNKLNTYTSRIKSKIREFFCQRYTNPKSHVC